MQLELTMCHRATGQLKSHAHAFARSGFTVCRSSWSGDARRSSHKKGGVDLSVLHATQGRRIVTYISTISGAAKFASVSAVTQRGGRNRRGICCHFDVLIQNHRRLARKPAARGKSPARRYAAVSPPDRGGETKEHWLKYEQVSTTKGRGRGRKQQPCDSCQGLLGGRELGVFQDQGFAAGSLEFHHRPGAGHGIG